MENNNCYMEELLWNDVSSEVAEVNPDLANAINELSPDKEYTLFKARYPYGAQILEQNQFYLPNNKGGLTDFSGVDRKWKEKLDYAETVPMGVVLNNSMERYIFDGNRLIPLGIYSPGAMVALWRILDPSISHHALNILNITAGARSIFMLPKISDEVAHKRLRREFGIQSRAPKSLQDQWPVFVELTQKNKQENDWYLEIIFFSKKWLEPRDDIGWIKFHHYLHKQGWMGTQFWRNNYLFNMIFSRALNSKNLRANPAMIDTAKHLIAMSFGAVPGFSVENSELKAPIKTIESIYNNIYQLRNNYAAILMAPNNFELGNIESIVYYSLSFPSAVELSPRSRALSSNLKDLLELKHILGSVFSDILSRESLRLSPHHVFGKKCSFEYFHIQQDDFNEVLPVSEIPECDESFRIAMKRQGDRVLCEASPFFKGCVRIIHNEIKVKK